MTDDDLEQTIRTLCHRASAAREGSAERRFLVRQLIGLRKGSQLGGLIFEELAMAGDRSVPLEIYG